MHTHVTEYVKKLLNVMEYEVPYTSTVLMEKLGLKSKETFRKNYMNPAMELQLVQMTIPEKPKSREPKIYKKKQRLTPFERYDKYNENGAACCSMTQTESGSETLQIEEWGTLRWK